MRKWAIYFFSLFFITEVLAQEADLPDRILSRTIIQESFIDSIPEKPPYIVSIEFYNEKKLKDSVVLNFNADHRFENLSYYKYDKLGRILSQHSVDTLGENFWDDGNLSKSYIETQDDYFTYKDDLLILMVSLNEKKDTIRQLRYFYKNKLLSEIHEIYDYRQHGRWIHEPHDLDPPVPVGGYQRWRLNRIKHSYYYDQHGAIRILIYDDVEKTTLRTVRFRYDKSGYQVFTYDSSFNGSVKEVKRIFDTQLSEEIIKINEPDETLDIHIYYRYLSDSSVVKTSLYSHPYEKEYKKEILITDKNGKKRLEEEYAHNKLRMGAEYADGKILYRANYRHDGSIHQKTEFTYDANGIIQKRIEHNSITNGEKRSMQKIIRSYVYTFVK